MSRRLRKLGILVALAVVVGGCAAGRAYRRGDAAMRAGDLDQAVAYYRMAVQGSPENVNYKIALERAMLAASRAHFQRAREFEAQDQLDAARSEYQLAAEYDPSNRQAAAKVAALEQTIRDRIEASRPRPQIDVLREQARAAAAQPLLSPATDNITATFTNQQLGQVLDFLGDVTNINIQYDSQVQRTQAVTVRLDGVSFEQALQQILTTNGLAYKVQNERSIIVYRDDVNSRSRYEDIFVQTFYISHADPTELTQILSNILRLPQGTQYMVQPNKLNNTILVRGTRAIVEIIGRLIEQNDKPRAEIVFDIEILEVDRARVKQYGLNLSEYAIGGIFSPEVSPSSTTTTTPGTPGTPTTTATGQSTPPSGVTSPPPFNLNTISQGVNTTDFYMAVPTAVVRFLESDTNTKIVAKPSLRGAEGSKLTLNLGEEIPIVTTSYTPIATGGVGVNPLNSFQLKPVGIIIEITPRVTVEGEIVIELLLESSSRGADVNVAGTNYPSFGSRRVQTRLRLRDGESNLLAGLLREDERKSLQGFPGAIHVPLLKQLFSSNDQTITQTDIVMLLTPHIVRTHGITETDLRPLYIGTQQNLNLGGAPPLLAPPPEPAPAAPAQPSVPGAPGFVPPPGSTPIPGVVPAPTPTPQQPQAPPGAPPPAPAPAPDTIPLPSPDAPTTPPPTPPPPGAGAAALPPTTLTDAPPATVGGFGAAQILMMPPGTTFRVGAGPYTVPINVTNAARLSTVTLTLTYDPAVLRLRSVQEGAFMRSGGANATFTQQTAPGRVDITIVRSADAIGASGSGILAAVLFDPVAPGSATLSLNGAATGPGGTPMGLQFRPVVISVQ